MNHNNHNDHNEPPICSCGWRVQTCTDCYMTLCGNKNCGLFQYFASIFGTYHQKCEMCQSIWVCKASICVSCLFPGFTFVTTTVAIGDRLADHTAFHIVVNMNYPSNGCNEGQSIVKNGNMLCIGITDDCTETNRANMAKWLCKINEWISSLVKGNPSMKILFQCFTGVSVSVTACIYYLSRMYRKSPKEVFNFVKTQYPDADPNPQFKELLSLV